MNKRRIIVFLTAVCFAHYCYFQSLEGAATIDLLTELLPRLSLLLVASSFLFTLAVFLLISASLPPRFPPLIAFLFKGMMLSFLVTSFLFAFSIDRGSTLQEHGTYNALLWVVISAVLSFAIYIPYALHLFLSPRQFQKTMLLLFLALLLTVPLRALRGNLLWSRGIGLHSALLSEVGGKQICTWKLGNFAFPWLDILPDGALNRWMGPQFCPASHYDKQWSLTFTAHVLKVIGCHERITWQAIPDTRNYTLSEKVFGQFQRTVYDEMQRNAQTYSSPVRVADEIDAVIVHCGKDSKIMIDVRPIKSLHELCNSTGIPASVTATQRPPNVLLILLDAVSRRHFLRKLPLTSAYLANFVASPTYSKQNSSWNFFEFFRAHVVGFSTDPNTRAAYTGDPDERNGKYASRTIWEMYHKEGYATMRTESNCEDWSSQYAKTTSSQYLSHEFVAYACHPDAYDRNGQPHGAFHGPYSITRRCLLGRYVHEYAVEFTTKFVNAYQKINRPWFASLTFLEGHEELLLGLRRVVIVCIAGTGEVIGTVDKAVHDLLQFLERASHMSNTAVILFGDHGLHMGPGYLFTRYGEVEHANPHLSMLLPLSLLRTDDAIATGKEREEALRHNEQALLTPVDLHYTLRTLSRLPITPPQRIVILSNFAHALVCRGPDQPPQVYVRGRVALSFPLKMYEHELSLPLSHKT